MSTDVRLVLTQEELASLAGVSVRCIRKIETGKVAQPRQSTLRQLADAFELSGEEHRRFCRLALATASGAGASVIISAGRYVG